jgi:hypothetical protein
LDNQGSKVWFPVGAGNFSLYHHFQNGSGAHPASYPVGTRGSFLGVKRLGCEADHSPPSSAEVKERVELYLHSPNTPSWRVVLLKHRDKFTFTFYMQPSVCSHQELFSHSQQLTKEINWLICACCGMALKEEGCLPCYIN